jgi:hypothetical protein
MNWIETFDGIFFITVITIITAFFGVVLRFCLRSKCGEINMCWGCLKINRNVELEQEEEMKAMELGMNREEEKKNNL